MVVDLDGLPVVVSEIVAPESAGQKIPVKMKGELLLDLFPCPRSEGSVDVRVRPMGAKGPSKFFRVTFRPDVVG